MDQQPEEKTPEEQESSRTDKYDVIDKTEWDRGAWDGEPDFSEFQDGGHLVRIARDKETGTLGFSVSVPKGHPAFGQEHAPVSPVDATVESGVESKDGWWSFCYRFDRAHHGRPAHKQNLSLYRTIHHVQAAAKNVCSQLSEFAAQAGWKGDTRYKHQLDIEDQALPESATAPSQPSVLERGDEEPDDEKGHEDDGSPVTPPENARQMARDIGESLEEQAPLKG